MRQKILSHPTIGFLSTWSVYEGTTIDAYTHTLLQGIRAAAPNIVTSSLPGYRVSLEGQTAMLRDVMSIVRAVPIGRGLGVFWWDATWTAVPGNGWDPADASTGNGWENQALFDFDDRPLPAMQEFSHP